jgi:pyridoxine/pyridoxamine 5'-phosphate oxidase
MEIQDIKAFVAKQKLAVVSTIDDTGKPQSAVVEFGELDDMTIIIDTLRTSRKYKNLQASPHVAIVIGWDESITVQISAVGHELSGAELAQAKESYFAKNARAQKWEDRPNIVYFAFRPTWIRYSDLNQDPWYIQEYDVAD